MKLSGGSNNHGTQIACWSTVRMRRHVYPTMADRQAVHKPGPLKQQNKSHKHGKHRSKGKIVALNKGKLWGLYFIRYTYRCVFQYLHAPH